MDAGLIFALIAATAVLVAIPGPNVALFIANTLAHGLRHGALTVLGTTLGVGLQLALIVLGLAIVLEVAASALGWLKWAGAAYLIWLGVRSWRQGVADMAVAMPSAKPLGHVFWQGMLLAMINPKTLLFSAAFLPQFVDPAAGGAFALMMPALVYLCVILLGDLCWVACAEVARPAILKLGRLRHRLTGALFIGSGIGLALARVEQ